MNCPIRSFVGGNLTSRPWPHSGPEEGVGEVASKILSVIILVQPFKQNFQVKMMMQFNLFWSYYTSYGNRFTQLYLVRLKGGQPFKMCTKLRKTLLKSAKIAKREALLWNKNNVSRNENPKSLTLQIKMAHCAKQGKQAVN